MSLSRTLRTIRHLRANQLTYLLLYRVLGGRSLPRFDAQVIRRRENVGLEPRPCLAPAAPRPTTFAFIGLARDFQNGNVDWNCPDVPTLWRYNLHYFDYLLDETRPIPDRDRLIDDWIARNPPGTADAWAPYPTSLRIVNWIDYFLRTEPSRRIPSAWRGSLYAQALWLENRIEHHILANHLMKNTVALLFAGTFFAGDDADRWLTVSQHLLEREIDEQILPDGGHYERSPMYHSIVTQDLLDVANLLKCSEKSPPNRFLEKIKNIATRSVTYLTDIAHPDGEIPLFNDCAFSISLSPNKLREYAENLFPDLSIRQNGGPLIEKSYSGYYGFRTEDQFMLIDCGEIGPKYQPGHAHCDLLSYELSMGERRVVVDSGVFGYEMDDLRAYIRSTAAHNTIRVDGKEQSEMWSAFRVGRRAKPLSAKAHMHSNGDFTFEGSHDGYNYLPQRVIHTRKIRYEAARQQYLIGDHLCGRGKVRAESFVHLHPDLRVEKEQSRLTVVEPDGKALVVVEADPSLEVSTQSGFYCPCFGVCQTNHVIVFATSRTLPFEMRYSLRKVVAEDRLGP